MCREQKQKARKGCKLAALKVATCNLQTTPKNNLKDKIQQRKIKKRYFLYFCTSTKNIFEMGKITVKHYLNTKIIKKDNKGNELFPVFIMVIFDRMTIRKASITKALLNEKEFNNKKSSQRNIFKKLEYEENLIYRIVEQFKNDSETKTISRNFLNFSRFFSYTSKNENLNLLNSYINFYTIGFCEIINKHISSLLNTEISKKLDNSFNFSENEEIKNDIIEVLKDCNVFAGYPQNTFLFNNVSEVGKKLLFLEFCYNRFGDKKGDEIGFFDIPLFEWFLNFEKIGKEYKNFVLNNEEIISESKKIDIDLNKEVENFQLNEIKSIINDPLFYEKYRI